MSESVREGETDMGAETLEIDGSFGEGGGQLLRTALYFSVLFSKPIHVSRIRAGRDVPGLKPQHAAVLRILADISRGTLEGGEVGSKELRFVPGRMSDGSVTFDLGTAASVTLVAQALIPAVALSGTSLHANFVGGTDVPWSPTSDYLESVIRPAFAMLGIDFGCKIGRRGYYPRGGGRAELVVKPCPQVMPVILTERTGSVQSVSVTSRCGSLPRHVAERQAAAATALLRQNSLAVGTSTVTAEDSSSPGSSILISLVDDGCLIGADGLGRRGMPAEQVGEGAATRFLKGFQSGATVDENLADSIAPILCLSRSPSAFHVPFITGHLRTSLYIARLFTGADFEFSKTEESSARPGWLVRVVPQQNS